MTTLAARFAALIAILGLSGLGFLAFVSYQGAQSVAVLKQVALLEVLGDAGAVDALVRVTVDEADAATVSGTLPAEILSRIVENRPVHDNWAETEGRRYVWTFTGSTDGFTREALVYVSEVSWPGPYFQYMLLPLLIAAAIVLWVSVWAGLSIARMVQRVDQQRVLEVSLAEETESRKFRDSFLAHLSHELRTPLNAIVGFSQVLNHEIFGSLGSAKNVEYAENIHRSGLHLVRLVGNILDHSRIALGEQTLAEDRFELEGALVECVSILSGEAERNGIAVTKEIAPTLPLLRADRIKVMQVLLNLLSNAIKFTACGDSVTITAEQGRLGGLEIRVTDTGIGISESDIQIVQKPFGRAGSDPHLTKDGTGLGLSLSTSLMKLHGGDLRLESVPGEGTTAIVSFPSDRNCPPSGGI